MEMFNELLIKNKEVYLFIVRKLAQQYEIYSISGSFFFLIQYSFLFSNNDTDTKTCTLKTTHFLYPQRNGENGARYLDPKYSHWMSTDPALGDYVSDSRKSTSGGIYNSKNFNLYHYANNNPIKYSDPNGKDAYLVIWATGEDVGHAGFAVDNYKQVENEDGTISYVSDGTVTYYDLWPGPGITVDASNVSKDVKAGYNKDTLTLEQLKTGSKDYLPDKRDADGIVKFTTSKGTDDATKADFDLFMQTDIYNGEKRNCSDMAKVGVKNSGQGNKIGLGREHAYFIKGFTTPNKLFNDSKKMKNATVILDPGKKTDVSFSKEIVKPAINNYISNSVSNTVENFKNGE